MTTVICHTLQHLLHFINASSTYAQNSFRNSIFAKYRTSIHLVKCTYYVLVLQFLHPKFLLSLSIAFNSTCVNYILQSTLQYTYLRNFTYHYIFVPKRLTQIFKSTFTHVSLYRPFIPNNIWNINKTSHHHIKKITFTLFFFIQITTFSSLI